MVLDRRKLLALLAGALAAPAQAQDVSRTTAYAFSFVGLDGRRIRLADHAGKPILIVNVASQCGYTPQYTGLQELWRRYGARGLFILGVPSNDYYQEPGATAQIIATAQGKYGVSFPLAAKASLRGEDAHPFYQWAALQKPLDAPRWNFHKYLIGRDGQIAAVFPTRIEPLDARVIEAIVKELPGD